jgi:polyhydroxyalkanoate synthesis regulator phasin
MEMADEQNQQQRGGASGLGDGIRSGIGILTAFKDALEETIQDAMTRGDLSPERAKQAVEDTVRRMQSGFDEARERLDFVPRKEFDALQARMVELRSRVDALERRSYPAGDSDIIVEAE